jgi:predicted hydrocarbon binding protein
MSAPQPTIPDRGMPSGALRLLFLSIEEVMGKDGIKAVLNGAKLSAYINNYPENTLEHGVTFGEYGRVEQAVEDFLGPRGARAILIRVGRELFRYSLREQSALLGIAGNALKNMPLISPQAKMKILLQQIVGAANKTVNQPARLEEDAENFYVVIDQCMCQWRPKHEKPCCLVTVGTFSEAMKWLTDRPVEVKEITCLNNGADACRYQIPKKLPEEA